MSNPLSAEDVRAVVDERRRAIDQALALITSRLEQLKPAKDSNHARQSATN